MQRSLLATAIMTLGASSAHACDLPSPADLTNAAFVKPIEADVTSGFGAMWHPILRYVRQHNGIDFSGPIGDPIVATLAGRVIEARYKGESGNFILIDHGAGITSSYAHLTRWAPEIASDTCVRPGDVIGFIGQTGLSAGPHLHFEIHSNGRPIDPAPLLGVAAPVPEAGFPPPPSRQ